jgi:hypothetical protein
MQIWRIRYVICYLKDVTMRRHGSLTARQIWGDCRSIYTNT